MVFSLFCEKILFIGLWGVLIIIIWVCELNVFFNFFKFIVYLFVDVVDVLLLDGGYMGI